MKTNKYMNWMLMAALALGLGMGLTACSDDDVNEKEKTEEEQTQEAEEQQELNNTAFAVLSQLADLSGATVEDFAGKTYEPTIGYESGGNTRVENTNTLEAAAQRFAYLTDADVDENTTTCTWKNDVLGTLTYTKVTDGTSWATVDVNIKQLPHLTQLIYRSPEQADNNGSFSGRAYYRFGDVVSREVDGHTEYWVCVRPAFGMEGKEDSHWMCLNSLPDKNVFKYEYREKEWHLPTGIGESKEHMQNLAELLYAMLYPAEWRKNITDYPKIDIFHDFSSKNIEYNNQYFFEAVTKAWDEKGIWQLVFDTDKEKLQNQLTNGGLPLLYKGYSWWTKLSWNCSLWVATYTNGTGTKSNMHNVTYTTPKKSMQNIGFDCRYMGGGLDNYKEFFDNDGKLRWCVRHATGKQLSENGRYEIRAAIPGVDAEYRYYADVLKDESLTDDPEVTENSVLDVSESPSIGSIIGADGKYYRTVALAKSKGAGAVAIVCALNGDKRVEKGAAWNGLAMALVEDEDDFEAWWSTKCPFEDEEVCGLKNVETLAQCAAQFNGIANTTHLVGGCNGRGHDHPAAKKARNYKGTGMSADAKKTGNFSDWFLPSSGQWILALKGFGYSWIDDSGWKYLINDRDYDDEDDEDKIKERDEELAKYVKYFEDAGAEPYKSRYWTSTPCFWGTTLAACFCYDFDNKAWNEDFNVSLKALPFIAFKYDGGATED